MKKVILLMICMFAFSMFQQTEAQSSPHYPNHEYCNHGDEIPPPPLSECTKTETVIVWTFYGSIPIPTLVTLQVPC